MTANIDRATSFENGITLGGDEQAGIFYEAVDPTVGGLDLPLNSLLISDSGIYRKIGSGTTEWQDTRDFVNEAQVKVINALTGNFQTVYFENISTNQFVTFLNISYCCKIIYNIVFFYYFMRI